MSCAALSAALNLSGSCLLDLAVLLTGTILAISSLPFLNDLAFLVLATSSASSLRSEEYDMSIDVISSAFSRSSAIVTHSFNEHCIMPTELSIISEGLGLPPLAG